MASRKKGGTKRKADGGIIVQHLHDTSEKAPQAKRTKTTTQTYSIVDATQEFTLNIERCNSWSMFRGTAGKIEQAISESYPAAKVVQNPNGKKPRKGSFEVTLVKTDKTDKGDEKEEGDEEDGITLHSKLDSFGAATYSRKSLPTVEKILEELAEKLKH